MLVFVPSPPRWSRLKRPGCWPKTLPQFSNLSCQIPTQPLLHMVQNVTGWLAPFPRIRHSPPPPLKFSPYFPFTSPLFFPSLRARELRAIIINIAFRRTRDWCLSVSLGPITGLTKGQPLWFRRVCAGPCKFVPHYAERGSQTVCMVVAQHSQKLVSYSLQI